MMKVLLVGANSYVGNSFKNWIIEQKKENYQIKKIGTRDDEWENISFSEYDVVIHLAAIAHIKESKKNRHLYYKVNRDLAYNVAKKAKRDGVKQFIFLSSMSVYGLLEGNINKDTKENPNNAYGQSKLEAEYLIKTLADNEFIVAILRPPMIYGRNCKGNYQLLSNFARKIKFFPNTSNQRSMIYIDNLSYYIYVILNEKLSGMFFPQNKDYVNTAAMVKTIAQVNQKNIKLISGFNRLLNKNSLKLIKKTFGSLVYDMDLMDNINGEIDFEKLISFNDSILFSERVVKIK